MTYSKNSTVNFSKKIFLSAAITRVLFSCISNMFEVKLLNIL